MSSFKILLQELREGLGKRCLNRLQRGNKENKGWKTDLSYCIYFKEIKRGKKHYFCVSPMFSISLVKICFSKPKIMYLKPGELVLPSPFLPQGSAENGLSSL